MNKKIVIDKYQDISIEIADEDYKKLSALAQEANITENELINTFIEYGLKNSVLLKFSNLR